MVPIHKALFIVLKKSMEFNDRLGILKSGLFFIHIL